MRMQMQETGKQYQRRRMLSMAMIVLPAVVSAFTCSPALRPHRFTDRAAATFPSFKNPSPFVVRSKTTPRASIFMEPPPTADSRDSKKNESFEQRMRNLVQKSQRNTATPEKKKSQSTGKRNNVQQVTTLDEYKKVVAGERERMVVVRFYATWCRACKAIAPLFSRMAAQNPDILFVEVPVTAENQSLHQGLGVPSLPFGHIYHPEAGLVEERRISRRFFSQFEQVLRWYSTGGCDLPDGESESPFAGVEEGVPSRP